MNNLMTELATSKEQTKSAEKQMATLTLTNTNLENNLSQKCTALDVLTQENIRLRDDLTSTANKLNAIQKQLEDQKIQAEATQRDLQKQLQEVSYTLIL